MYALYKTHLLFPLQIYLNTDLTFSNSFSLVPLCFRVLYKAYIYHIKPSIPYPRYKSRNIFENPRQEVWGIYSEMSPTLWNKYKYQNSIQNKIRKHREIWILCQMCIFMIKNIAIIWKYSDDTLLVYFIVVNVMFMKQFA